MNRDQQHRNRSAPVRLAALAVAGIVIANVVAAVFIDRDRGLGIDDILVVLAGLGLAAVVEFAVFRRS